MKCTPLLTATLIIMLLTLGSVLAPNILADSPLVINYQGRLTNSSGDPVPDGDYSLTFSIWDDSTGGLQLWTETHSSVSVTNGTFTAQLGSNTTIEVRVLRIDMAKSSQTDLSGRYLEIQVGSSAPLTPRTPLDFVPFSGIARAVSGDFISAPGEILLVDTTTGDTSMILKVYHDTQKAIINNIRAVAQDGDSNTVAIRVDTSKAEITMNKADLIEAIASDANLRVDSNGAQMRMESTDGNNTTMVELKANSSSGGMLITSQEQGATPDTLFSLRTDTSDVEIILTSKIKNEVKIKSSSITFTDTLGDTTILISSSRNSSGIGINEEGIKRVGMNADTSGSSIYINGFGSFIVKRFVPPDTMLLLELGADSISSQLHIADLNNDGNIDLVVDSSQSRLVLMKKPGYGLVWMEAIVDSGGPSLTMVDSSDTGSEEVILKSKGLWWLTTSLGTDTSVSITNNGNAYFSGSVGIGLGALSPSNILTVKQSSTTDPIADAWTTYSSRRWKTNIKTIDKAVEKVHRLRGVTYQWKKDGKKDIGLIAEEVGKVIPEIVVYEENGKDAKSVDYARIVALLIEAVKEQQNTITAMQNKLDETGDMKAEIAQLTAIVKTLLAERNSTKNGKDKLAIKYNEEP